MFAFAVRTVRIVLNSQVRMFAWFASRRGNGRARAEPPLRAARGTLGVGWRVFQVGGEAPITIEAATYARGIPVVKRQILKSDESVPSEFRNSTPRSRVTPADISHFKFRMT